MRALAPPWLACRREKAGLRTCVHGRRGDLVVDSLVWSRGVGSDLKLSQVCLAQAPPDTGSLQRCQLQGRPVQLQALRWGWGMQTQPKTSTLNKILQHKACASIVKGTGGSKILPNIKSWAEKVSRVNSPPFETHASSSFDSFSLPVIPVFIIQLCLSFARLVVCVARSLFLQST